MTTRSFVLIGRRICGACHIAPLQLIRRPIRKIRAGKISPPRSATNTSAKGKSLPANVEKGGFFYEMLEAQPPGTSDTSRIATDHINNPNAINAIFLLADANASRTWKKWPAGLSPCPARKPEMPVPHILKDGADSVGVRARRFGFTSTSGCFPILAERHDRLIGLIPQEPFEIPYAREHSSLLARDRGTTGEHRGFLPKTVTVSSGGCARR